MKLNFTTALTVLKSTGIVVLLSALSIGKTQAQCGYAVGLGCNNTDYTNFGLNSNSDAATIEYDNFVSGFHSSVIRGGDGKYYVWGEKTGSNGSSNRTSKTEINSTSFPQITGTILKTTMATAGTSGTALIVLTTDGLFAGGARGNNGVFASSVSPNTSTFSKLTHSGTYGLPTGVTPTDVKMMFATYQTLAIVTCDGQGWVMSQNSNMRGNGASGASNAWHRVQTNSSTNLNDIIAIRGTNQALFALTQTSTGAQNLYTWGSTTRVIGGNQTSRSYATLVTKPKATGSIKMIGATYNGLSSGNNEAGVTYYVLYTDGELYSMGNNSVRQLGNWANTTSHTSQWVQPSYPNATNSGPGTAMTNIKWISPNEHDNFGNACINVINADGRLWNFGTNSANMLGRQLSGSSTSVGTNPQNPGQPFASNPQSSHNNFNPSTSTVLAIETGGHTTLQITQCEEKFGYIGHAINGSAATSANTTYDTYTYTAEVDVCGAEAVAAINTVIEPLTGANQRVCAGQTVYLAPVPPGGSLTIIANTAGAVLTGNALTFNNTTGSVTLQYQVTTTCGPQTVTRIFEITDCPLQYITGTVWVDNNKNAVKDGMEHGSNASSSSNGGLWATLVNDDGEVVASVPVNTDGTYSIPQNTSTTGNFTVTITNAQVGGGTTIPNSATSLPPTWVYTGNNPASNIPCLLPACTDPGTIPVTLSGTGSSGNDFGINGIYKVRGSVFHDPNGLNNNAVDGDEIYNTTTPSAYQNQNHPQLYVSVIDVATGKLIQYVPVKPDGTYEVDVPLDQNVVLRLTTTPGTVSQTAPAPTLPNGWSNVGEAFGFNNSEGTNNNDGTGTGSNAPLTRYDGDVHLSFANNTLPASDLNFGIQQPPVADPKEYHVANGYFGSTAGFPPITGYKAIPMSSAGLVESTNNSNGSLSGQDPEDCPSANCNGNGGSNILSTFTIGIINTNTKLYYDFGEGPVEVFNNTPIENFDITKMAIYGAIGQGASGNELGFTYALMDKAGITSPFVSYLITTIEALPLQLLDFTGYVASFTSVLNWNTAKEENVSHFEIMRSTDGRKWNEIGQVKALNNPINNSYNFIDQKPHRGVNYYKLFMKDIDATGSYSKIIILSHDQIAQQIIVGPNPVKDKLTIDFKGFEQQTSVLMTMYNNNGSIVWPQSVYTSTEPITMDIAQFASGVYIIEIKTDTDTFIEKIVKQ